MYLSRNLNHKVEFSIIINLIDASELSELKWSGGWSTGMVDWWKR